MTVISNLMKRLGWVRASDSEFEMAPTGQAGAYGGGSNFDFIPETPADPASCFDPNLAAQPASTLPPPVLNAPLAAAPAAEAPKPAPSPEASATSEAPAEDDEENWEALMAAARAKEDDDEEEDWDALMAAAQARANDDAPSASQILAAARDRAKSEPPFVPEVSPVFAAPPPQVTPVDAASAQVERGALAANDDRPAVQLTAVPAVTTPIVAAPIAAAQPVEENEEWLRLRADVDAREDAEMARKLRAMREIHRLRGQRGNTGSVPVAAPYKRRLASGTAPPPMAANAKRSPLVISPGPVKAPPTKARAAAPTARSLPRITQRLSKGTSSQS